jgi:hypothetical protein
VGVTDMKPETRNPKSEGRNPKAEGSFVSLAKPAHWSFVVPLHERSRLRDCRLPHSGFGFRPSFGFRISAFGFRGL